MSLFTNFSEILPTIFCDFIDTFSLFAYNKHTDIESVLRTRKFYWAGRKTRVQLNRRGDSPPFLLSGGI